MSAIHKQTYTSLLRILIILLFVLQTACSDDLDVPGGHVTEGKPAEVKLRINLTEAPHASRADERSTDLASRVNTLWIALFDSSGKCTYQRLFSEGDTGFVNATEMFTQTFDVTLNCLSGRQNMVAVANPVNNYGVWNDGHETPVVRRLEKLLEQVETLDDYLNISSVLTQPTNVDRISANFPMSGVYSTDPKNPPAKTYDGNDKPAGWVDINPGNNTLTGCIFLRRQASQSKFNIIADPNISVTPISWQVINVPSLSFLSERSGNSGSTSTALLGLDHYNNSNYNNSNPDRIFSQGELTTATGSPVTVGTDSNGKLSTKVSGGKQATGLSFEFFTFGNKHTGLNHVTGYDDREKEHKDATGKNTGIFKSLVMDPKDTDNDNNHATYVIIKLQLDYSVKDNKPVAKDTEGSVLRTAIASFKIHMGYCEGATEAEKARDFNIRRNMKYTYNVIVNGVDNIRVEAIGTGNDEPQPGLEGDVNDAGAQIFELDAHYSQFNITLTNEERTKLSYQVQTPFGDNVWNYNSKSRDDGLTPPKGKEQFTGWIEFRPALYHVTDKKDYMATYTGTDIDDMPWSLAQLGDPANYPGYMEYKSGKIEEDIMPAEGTAEYDAWLHREHYYTVFINEYAYDNDYEGNTMMDGNGQNSGWYLFANKDNRIIRLMNEDSRHISADGNSTYIKAKYIITQESIQTYYNTDPALHSTTAIGIEHTNESLGLNLEWRAATPTGGWSNENGRLNMRNYYGENKPWNDLRITKKFGGITFLEQEIVPGLNHPDYGLKPENKPAYTFAMIGGSITYSTTNDDANPDDKRAFDPMNLCMARNRDNNGNGIIDDDEIRWILPTYTTYGRIIAGSTSLADPLVNYSTAIAYFPYDTWNATKRNSLHHFITSDKRYIWAEEGLSFSNYNYTEDDKSDLRAFWNLRCVRNLGINHSKILDTQPAEPAYSVNTATHKVTMTYYDPANFHAPTAAPIEVHQIHEKGNTMTQEWEYRPESTKLPSFSNTDDAIRIIEANPCNIYNVNGETGWRVPNQRELTILFNKGIVDWSLHISCSREFFPMGEGKAFCRIMGTNIGVVTAFSNANLKENNNKYVRCVRDVIDFSRFDIPTKRR